MKRQLKRTPGCPILPAAPLGGREELGERPLEEGSLQKDHYQHNPPATTGAAAHPGFAKLAVYPGVPINAKSKKTTDHISINKMSLTTTAKTPRKV